jgi:hypothetical protein
MTNDKFNYPIFPDRIYSLTYPDFVYKISGEDIMSYFRRGAYLEKMLEEMYGEVEKENDQSD